MDITQALLYGLETLAATRAVGPIARALSMGDIETAQKLCDDMAFQHNALLDALKHGEWPCLGVAPDDLRSFQEKYGINGGNL